MAENGRPVGDEDLADLPRRVRGANGVIPGQVRRVAVPTLEPASLADKPSLPANADLEASAAQPVMNAPLATGALPAANGQPPSVTELPAAPAPEQPLPRRAPGTSAIHAPPPLRPRVHDLPKWRGLGRSRDTQPQPGERDGVQSNGAPEPADPPSLTDDEESAALDDRMAAAVHKLVAAAADHWVGPAPAATQPRSDRPSPSALASSAASLIAATTQARLSAPAPATTAPSEAATTAPAESATATPPQPATALLPRPAGTVVPATTVPPQPVSAAPPLPATPDTASPQPARSPLPPAAAATAVAPATTVPPQPATAPQPPAAAASAAPPQPSVAPQQAPGPDGAGAPQRWARPVGGSGQPRPKAKGKRPGKNGRARGPRNSAHPPTAARAGADWNHGGKAEVLDTARASRRAAAVREAEPLWAKPRTDPRRSARRWQLAGVLAVVVVLSAIAVGVSLLHRGAKTHPPGSDGSLRIATETQIRSQAVSWVTSQVGHNIVVGCDSVVCSALAASGFPVSNLNIIVSTAPDPYGSVVLISTADLRSQFGTKLGSFYAPMILASFGSGSERIDVRLIADAGFKTALSKDSAARKAAGKQLLTNKRITFSVAAHNQLANGSVELRLTTAIAFIAGQHPISIVAFGDSAPGASPGVPLRYVYLAESDPAARLGSRYLRTLTATIMHQMPAQFVPLSVVPVRLGGHYVLRIEYPAPSPLGLPSS